MHDTWLGTDSDIDDVYLTWYVSDVGSREESGETVSIFVAHLGKRVVKRVLMVLVSVLLAFFVCFCFR